MNAPEAVVEPATNQATGLTSAEAQARLAKYGINGIVEKEDSQLEKLLGYFTGSIAYMIEAAAVISALLGRWSDFAIITALLLFNAIIGFWQDHKAANALAALKKGLAPEADVLRDGKWQMIKAELLVPGDIVRLHIGQIVPADLKLIGGTSASIDQSALTGESLPVAKRIGDTAYSGSIIKDGDMTGEVIATGSNTLFGRTAKLVASAGAVSHGQRAVLEIGDFLVVIAIALALIMVGFDVYRDIVAPAHWQWQDALSILQFVLILLVASIPVAMPAVFSITMALGALALAKQKAIVSKLSAIEEMAGVDVLCSDKTGTLTKNELTLDPPVLFAAKSADEAIVAAALATAEASPDALDVAVMQAVHDRAELKPFRQLAFVPFDPVHKRTEATVQQGALQSFKVSKGMPEVIFELCKLDPAAMAKARSTVVDLGSRGYRTLAVARTAPGTDNWSLLAILPMSDPPRDDSKATIADVESKGIRVKMVTGDDTAVAREMARQLGMGDNIITAGDFFPPNFNPDAISASMAEKIDMADGFARVYPEHKYAIVKALQSRGHLVAMTGDGVNDAPALKQADCGTAVSGATDAARSAAALILTTPGLTVIANAIDEARRIFARITSYTLYRIALTINIMVLVVMSTIVFGFKPLTAVMIVILALLDDAPIMAIAYDNTEVARQPIRWRITRLLVIASAIAVFVAAETFGLLLIGMKVIADPALQARFGLSTPDELRTLMFLQLAVGGHLLLYNTRTRKWFFQRPWPSVPLLAALLATELLAVLMAVNGWFVTPISWQAVGWLIVYLVAWLIIIDVVKRVIYGVADDSSALRRRYIAMVSDRL
ncbi:MAG TPA: plasma-membrane proton-efflux P-type ATPase [Aestuariivirgaceae bacterium]|nr:plasma-membrane proton-efflux P-type ATPase [Aestuariivirgaceae bacterium]